MTRWAVQGRLLAGDGRPRVMGILNVTPDSFSDGGRHQALDAALAHARHLCAEGADLLDIGGESTRPGADPVPLEEELRRVLPVVEALAPATDCPLSIDTMKPEVARRAMAAGVAIVNDVGGLRDPEMLRVVAGSGAAVVIMHMAGTPQTMQDEPRYGDVVTEVYDYLARQLDRAEAHGIARERVAIDPGIGFGKTQEHNLSLLRQLDRFATLGSAVLIGTSRKGMLGILTGRPREGRQTASVVSALAALVAGAQIARVHDVGPMVDAIRVWTAQRGWDTGS